MPGANGHIKEPPQSAEGAPYVSTGGGRANARSAEGAVYVSTRRQKRYRKECGGSGICVSTQAKDTSKECAGAGICEHGRRKRYCKEARAAYHSGQLRSIWQFTVFSGWQRNPEGPREDKSQAPAEAIQHRILAYLFMLGIYRIPSIPPTKNTIRHHVPDLRASHTYRQKRVRGCLYGIHIIYEARLHTCIATSCAM
jgi:hypothetical protein